MSGEEGLLDGLRVLDLSLWQPGHYASQLLADLGAQVLKVEPPGGDRMRGLPDRFVNYNGGKHAVVLDLKTADGRGRFYDLVDRVDVVIEGFRPGVAARLRVGYDDLSAIKPALVYCSITGYGQTGSLSDAPGHDWNYQAYAGAMSPAASGQFPLPARPLIGDFGGGMTAAFSIVAALLGARRTGIGEHVDVAMTDVIAGWVAPLDAVDPRRAEAAAHIEAPGHGIFAVADGYVVLGVFSEDRLWDRLCVALELGQLSGLTLDERTLRAHELRTQLAQTLATHHRDDLVRRLGSELPISPVLTREQMLEHPHFTSRGLVVLSGPDGMRTMAHPVRYRRHPSRAPSPAPGLPPTGSVTTGVWDWALG